MDVRARAGRRRSPAGASRRLAVARAGNGEVEGHGQERERRVGDRAAPRQPSRAASACPSGQNTVDASPPSKRDLRDRPPGRRPPDPGERREGRLVEREPHGERRGTPTPRSRRDVVSHRDAEAAQRVEERARDHGASPAVAVDRAAGRGRAHAHHDERQGQAAVDERAAPAEVGRDLLAEDGDQVIGDAPRRRAARRPGRRRSAGESRGAVAGRRRGRTPADPRSARLTPSAAAGRGSPGGCRPRC